MEEGGRIQCQSTVREEEEEGNNNKGTSFYIESRTKEEEEAKVCWTLFVCKFSIFSIHFYLKSIVDKFLICFDGFWRPKWLVKFIILLLIFRLAW